eukprot:scaffold5771_cov171-Amphora_coffeaeformis.AAC.2
MHYPKIRTRMYIHVKKEEVTYRNNVMCRNHPSEHNLVTPPRGMYPANFNRPMMVTAKKMYRWLKDPSESTDAAEKRFVDEKKLKPVVEKKRADDPQTRGTKTCDEYQNAIPEKKLPTYKENERKQPADVLTMADLVALVIAFARKVALSDMKRPRLVVADEQLQWHADGIRFIATVLAEARKKDRADALAAAAASSSQSDPEWRRTQLVQELEESRKEVALLETKLKAERDKHVQQIKHIKELAAESELNARRDVRNQATLVVLYCLSLSSPDGCCVVVVALSCNNNATTHTKINGSIATKSLRGKEPGKEREKKRSRWQIGNSEQFERWTDAQGGAGNSGATDDGRIYSQNDTSR